jgi:hypothetical protein
VKAGLRRYLGDPRAHSAGAQHANLFCFCCHIGGASIMNAPLLYPLPAAGEREG